MRHFEASTDAARDRHMREMMSLSLSLSFSPSLREMDRRTSGLIRHQNRTPQRRITEWGACRGRLDVSRNFNCETNKRSVRPIPKRSDCDPLLVCREREKLTFLRCFKSSLTILPDRKVVKMNVGNPRKDATESKLYL